MSIEEQLHQRGFAEVDFALSPADLRTAVQAFLGFFALPAAVKASWSHTYRISAGARESFVGYVRKMRKDDDHKEYFHYNAVFENAFADRRSSPADPAVTRLLDSVRPLYATTLTCLEQSLDVLPGQREQFFRPGVDPRVTLRFVSYRARPDGESLANGHYDRSAFTLALAESGPGLRFGFHDGDLTEVSRPPAKALLFPGRQQERFRPIWHDVVNVATRATPGDEVRWAIVAFANTPGRAMVASVQETNTPIRG
jgi:isopenicillin N synthase-like dioxygenase